MVKEKVVLAFSGGLDTSVCVRYLQIIHKVDVITLTVDCGQNEDFQEVEIKAKALAQYLLISLDEPEIKRLEKAIVQRISGELNTATPFEVPIQISPFWSAAMEYTSFIRLKISFVPLLK